MDWLRPKLKPVAAETIARLADEGKDVAPAPIMLPNATDPATLDHRNRGNRGESGGNRGNRVSLICATFQTRTLSWNDIDQDVHMAEQPGRSG